MFVIDRLRNRFALGLAAAALAVCGSSALCAQAEAAESSGVVVSWQQMLAAEAKKQANRGAGTEPSAIPLVPGPRPPAGGVSRQESGAADGGSGHAQFPWTLGDRGIVPTLRRNFLAIADNGTAFPPDTTGAVGKNHLMAMTASEVRIQDKDGNDLGTVSLETFWHELADGTDPYAPRLVYDPTVDLWYAACNWVKGSDRQVFFAISITDDPTGQWYFKWFGTSFTHSWWGDHPGLGFNKNLIVIADNMYQVGSNTFAGVKIWAIDKPRWFDEGVIKATTFSPDNVPELAQGLKMQPCATLDPDQEVLYLVDNNWEDTGTGDPLIRLSKLTGDPGNPVWSEVDGSVYMWPGTFVVENKFQLEQIDAAQKGSDELIETNDALVINAVFRHGHIWCTHSGGLPATGTVNQTAVFWYEIDPTAMPNPIVQSGLDSGGAGVHHFFPSIAVNSSGDVCLGFSHSSAALYVQGTWAYRSVDDPEGQLSVRKQLKEGEDSYVKLDNDNRNRWGDYSATVVDPSDDVTFWTIQEYAQPGNMWGTWWGEIGIADDCNDNGEPDDEEMANCPPGEAWCADCNGNNVLDECENLEITIKTPPADLTVCAGQPAVFSVSANGTEPFGYQWRKGGVPIDGATKSVLTIAPAAQADAGVYDVVVTDACTSDLNEEVTSASARLTVLRLVIDAHPESQSAPAGETVTFEVVASGLTPLTYQWRKDGKPIEGAIQASYTIQWVLAEHAGVYDVVVTSPCGPLASNPATLTVTLGAPSLPDPEDKATDVPIDIELSWASVYGATGYDVYFGTSPTPPLKGESEWSSWEVDEPPAYSTKYYWRVVAWNVSASASGPVWSFTTEAEPPNPPGEPSTPFPGDGAVGVACDVRLAWGEAAGATIYNVLLSQDKAFADGGFAGSTVMSHWDSSDLNVGTKYYWRIIAKNMAGFTPGPVWSFTTTQHGATAPEDEADAETPDDEGDDSDQDIPDDGDQAGSDEDSEQEAPAAVGAALCPLTSAGMLFATLLGLWATRRQR